MASYTQIGLQHRKGSRRMLYLCEQYKAAHPDQIGPVDPDAVSTWALETGAYRPEPVDPQKLLRRTIRGALRNDYFEDPQGREVHTYHPEMVQVHTADGVIWKSTWHRIFEMPPELMRASGQLRRRGAFRDVRQISIDFDSYNDNNIHKANVDKPDFNFNKDLEEMMMPTEYPDEATLEDEDDQDI
jgi:hypothetical protein